VSQASALIDRVAVAARRVTGAPQWPPAAGALLGLLAIGEVLVRGEGLDHPVVPLLLAVGTTVPLALARGDVLAAAVTITSATFLTIAGGQRPTVAGVAAELAVVHLLGRRRSAWASLLVVLPFVVHAITPLGGDGDRRSAVVLLSLTAAAAALGGARRARSQTVERDASRQAIAGTLLAHATRGERVRIAQELHDVVAHHISMIAMQAEIARLTTPGMPAEGASRLTTIGDTARTALTEMRRLLGLLREDAGAVLARRPQPGLEQLVELLDEARDAAGTSTRLIVRGRVAALDPGIELTAYRIVQEALTNARRHAPGAAVDVELHYLDGALRLRVRDNGPGPPEAVPASGHGLLGMRERAAMVGGTLRAGPAPASGFLVEAELPTAEAAG
jgi:signal transduction histidine kinase